MPQRDTSGWCPADAAADEILPWLRSRNRLPGDRFVADHVLTAPMTMAGDLDPDPLGFDTTVGLFVLLPSSVRLIRAHGSTPRRIGLYLCDFAAIVNRTMAQIWSLRAVLACLSAVSTLMAGGSVAMATAFGFVAWAMMGWRGRVVFPIYLATLIWTGFDTPFVLLLQVPAFYLYRYMRIFFASWTYHYFSPAVLISPAAFLGRFTILRALWSQTTASILLAVDKATHDDRARAASFIDAAMPSAPAPVRPVLLQCRANSAAARLEFQQALTLSQQARDLAAQSSAAIRGWCALQFGDVLLAAGQPAAAAQHWQDAADLLTYQRRTRYWRIEADLRMAEALTADLGNLPQCMRGLELIRDLRASAVRATSVLLLNRTEFLLLRLMHLAGNTVGVVQHLQMEHDFAQGAKEDDSSFSEYARRKVLLAALSVELIEHPERYPDLDTDDLMPTAERYERAATLCDSVLSRLSRTTDPLTEAHIYAVLARIRAGQHRHPEALANALASLNAVQQVRYQLPTTTWRTQWATSHAQTYALAIRLAADQHDGPLVAELLEVIRAQAVPLDTDHHNAFLRAVFDAVVSNTHLPEAFGVPESGAEYRSDPVLTDPTVLVLDGSWVGGELRTAIHLDSELTTMYPGCWYWSFGRVGDAIYHTIRSPQGLWNAVAGSFETIEKPFAELAWHLPIHLPGYEFPEDRLPGTALAVDSAACAAEDSTSGEVFSRLFRALGAGLIPEFFARILGQPGLHTLVVAPTGALATIPITALHIDEDRTILDVATVVHLPSIALLAHRRRSYQPHARPSRRDADHVLTVLVPHCASGEDPDGEDLPHAEATIPPRSTVLRRPLTKHEFATQLNKRRTESGTLLLAGHIRRPNGNPEPGTSGYEFHDGILSIRDFYQTTLDGHPLYRMPSRVILAGCSSLGIESDAASDIHRTATIHAPEWLGIGAAAIHANAEHVICTLYPLPDTETTRRIDLALVDAIRAGFDPITSLRQIVLNEFNRWQTGGSSVPLAFLAYAYVGLGSSMAGRSIDTVESRRAVTTEGTTESEASC